jgi:hypothetical protein
MTRLRVATPALLATACALLVGASGAHAQSVFLGSTLPPGSGGEYSVQTAGIQVSTGPSSPSYTVPEGSWTITCWTTQSTIDEGGSEHEGSARLRVYRPLPNQPGSFGVLAESDERFFPFSAEEPVSFPTSIPVEGGDVLGLKSGSRGAPVLFNTDEPGDLGGFVQGDPGVGGVVTPSTSAGVRVNVAAALQPAGQPAPPSCADTRRPRIDLRYLADVIRRSSVVIRFTSKEPVEYVVSLDGKRLKDDESPVRLRGLDVGRHVLKIVATDSAGNRDKEKVVFERLKG